MHPQPSYGQPYLDPTYTDEPMGRRSSLSNEYDVKAYESQGHGDPEETYYPETYGTSQARKATRGIWSYDDRRAFQQESWFLKLLRLVGFILVIGVIIALSVVLLIVMFLRPPNVGLKNLELPQSASDLQVQDERFMLNATIDAVISNPNYVSAQINNLNATVYDAHARKTSIGVCYLEHKTIEARENTTVRLPCEMQYDFQKDQDLSIIKDIVNRCGLVKGSKKQKIQALLDVHVTIQLLAFHIPISAGPTISMDCPVTRRQVKEALGNHSDILEKLGLGDLKRHVLHPSPVRNLAQRLVRSLYAGTPLHDTL